MGNAVAIRNDHALMMVMERSQRVANVVGTEAVRVVKTLNEWYVVVDEKVLGPTHAVIQKEMVRRVQRAMDIAEVKSKIFFVKSISTTTIAQTYLIDIADVRGVGLIKREYDVQNCGPELPNIPSIHGVPKVVEITDTAMIEVLLSKCMWAEWQPPASWRLKTDQIYDMTVRIAVRKHGFLTDETRTMRFRIGRKWIGLHHHHQDNLTGDGDEGSDDERDAKSSSLKCRWLHRTDYEVRDQVHTAESLFFQLVDKAWKDRLEQEKAELLQQQLKTAEDRDRPGTAGAGRLDYEAQEVQTSLRIQYMVESSLEKILKDQRTLFRTTEQFELWRMEHEDPLPGIHDMNPLHGPLLTAPITELMELYETRAMTVEDVKILI